ncbi:MAG: Lrp/AsnC family transcriptional regulator [Anaerolineae bacterium]|nr:Lrp/AsnC family transcriptional regulator [Anaerolineae bacterium]
MEFKNNMLSPADLDEVDHAIIAALRQDGRTAFAQIAQQLNVSPGMIRVRYNRLVQLGYLQVVAITNPLRLGYHTMAIIGIRADGSRLVAIAEQIAALEEIDYLVITTGRFDILAEVTCRNQEDLLHFLTEKLYKIDGVHEAESFVHLKIVKEVYF